MEDVCLELRVIPLTLAMGKREVRATGIEVSVPEEGPTHDFVGDLAQPLAGGDTRSWRELLDRHEAVIREDLMIASELNAHTTSGPSPLG